MTVCAVRRGGSVDGSKLIVGSMIRVIVRRRGGDSTDRTVAASMARGRPGVLMTSSLAMSVRVADGEASRCACRCDGNFVSGGPVTIGRISRPGRLRDRSRDTLAYAHRR